MEELVHMPLSNGQTLWRMRAKLLIIIRLRYYTSQKKVYLVFTAQMCSMNILTFVRPYIQGKTVTMWVMYDLHFDTFLFQGKGHKIT